MTYDQATDAMNTMFWDYFKPKAVALLGYEPTVYWHLTKVPDKAPTDKAWIRIIRRDAGGGGLAGYSDSVRRYDRNTLYQVQIFYPHTDPLAGQRLPELSQFAKDSMEGCNDPTNVLWNRDAFIEDHEIEKSWFRQQVVALFNYQEIKYPRSQV